MRPRLALALLTLACNPDSDSDAAGDSTGSETSSTSSAATAEPTTSPTTAPAPTTGDDEPTAGDPDTTAASETGPPAGGCTDLPLCDDFESAAPGGPPDAALWTVTSPNCSGAGALQVDDVEAHGGARSLRVDGGGGYCDHVFIANTSAIEQIGPVVYGRLWLRFGAALGQGHVTFLTLRDSADSGGKDLRMGGQSEIFMWNRESDDATLPALSPAGIAMSGAPTPGQWTCVEFMIDEAQGLLSTWVDGNAVPGLAVDADPTPDADQQWHNKPMWRPTLADFKVGWESYAGQTMTLHVDDVALADQRVGCL
ncbi:MAG: hypothetical protein JNL82_32605 [Myxococcales bacterium]|nr:hypothetical protein [Myxococcales bacterium]